ncbi:hypothetical protein [Devosia ginsengisoli]|uniref:hypothetical protein n=1 Tax=Devosia ginsengisoli TaxID=400770 RepID=UPI0026EEF7B3|nr:hypothetical protein [Devosia ginsengisoli]MCR6671314.1 hypothetical protein [Devosia ginsengisoli]
MAVFSLRPRAFRIRNPGRDAETDQVRLETVRNAIAMALGDARRERDGLQQRLDLYHAQAATMIDTSGDYGTRAAADETVIRSAEQNAANARRRLQMLDVQIGKFTELMAELDSGVAASAASATGNGAA